MSSVVRLDYTHSFNKFTLLPSRVYFYTRKPQKTLTWSLRTVPLSRPPTWTILRGVSPSLNWKGTLEQNKLSSNLVPVLNPVHAPRVMTAATRHPGKFMETARSPDTSHGEPSEWTWWSLPSASLLLRCSAGRDPRWAETNHTFARNSSRLMQVKHFTLLWLFVHSCLSESCGGGRGTRRPCLSAAMRCMTPSRYVFTNLGTNFKT